MRGVTDLSEHLVEEILTTLGLNYAGAAGRSLARYLLICGGGFGLFWVFLHERLSHRKIQDGVPDRALNWAEARDSIVSTLVIAGVTALTLYGESLGVVKIYMDPMEHGVGWLAATLFLLVFGFDTYFYWTHRLMHDVKLYSWTHARHHASTDPSPLAAYSFTPWEALTYAVFGPLVLLVLPVNFYVLLLAGSWFTLASMMVHLGYELAPRWWGKSVLTRWIGTSTMHNMHHEYTHYNFALYFTFWDRLMGTMHPDYDEVLAELTDQPLFQRRQVADDVAAK